MSSSSKVNRGRTLARSQALQILFQAEALNESVERVLEGGDLLLSKGPLDEYAAVLAQGCYENLMRIDAALRAVSENWALERMPGTDRNLLRLAVFELRFLSEEERLDDAVVINEAVEVAKAYGTDASSKFVNGVLGRIASEGELPGASDGGEGVPEGAEGGSFEVAPDEGAAADPEGDE